MKEKVDELNNKLKDYDFKQIIQFFIEEYKEKLLFASSLGAEDQVITKVINDIDPEVKIITLDTGRLFPETYELIHKTSAKYDVKIQCYFPQYQEVEKMVNEKGINLFYDSIENRKQCCFIRKVKPLQRAFEGVDVWICGLRKDQSVTRKDLQFVEWDKANNMLKVNPLLNWSEQDVWDYINAHNIPYNELHDKGFNSIGCQPCTRAIKEGEDIRAGRWWWERPEEKECGLHSK